MLLFQSDDGAVDIDPEVSVNLLFFTCSPELLGLPGELIVYPCTSFCTLSITHFQSSSPETT